MGGGSQYEWFTHSNNNPFMTSLQKRERKRHQNNTDPGSKEAGGRREAVMEDKAGN